MLIQAPPYLHSFIDHTLLRADATDTEVLALCREAALRRFASVCVNSSFVPLCADALRDADSVVCTVTGFPLGAASTQAKAAEAVHAIEQGASEIDMVIHIGRLKSGDTAYVHGDIAEIVRQVKSANAQALVKVIIETCLLSDQEKQLASRIAHDAGADFVKTSTGFGGGGATTHDIRLMRESVGPAMGVKASGGVKTLASALDMIAHGATRIGTSSGVSIIQQFESSRSIQQ